MSETLLGHHRGLVFGIGPVQTSTLFGSHTLANLSSILRQSATLLHPATLPRNVLCVTLCFVRCRPRDVHAAESNRTTASREYIYMYRLNDRFLLPS